MQNSELGAICSRHHLELDVNGYVIGVELKNNGARSDLVFSADRFAAVMHGGIRLSEFDVHEHLTEPADQIALLAAAYGGGVSSTIDRALGIVLKARGHNADA